MINLVIGRARELKVELKEYLSETEVGYLELPGPKIYKTLEEMRTKLQVHEFLTFLAEMSRDNKEMILALNKDILQGVKEFQSKRYRQFFLLF